MIPRRLILALSCAAIVGVVLWLALLARGPENPAAPIQVKPAHFRLGLIPDRNLFEQRKAYRELADYLQTHGRMRRGTSTVDKDPPLEVELVTSSNYEGVLKDFASGDVDGAFLGSLVTVMAVDRSGAQVLAKSQNLAGRDTYCGVLFVPEKSDVHALSDLSGRKVAAVRTTTAGVIYPFVAFEQAGIAGRPEFVWSGTHDDVIEEVVAGRIDAGAVKDLRLDAYEKGHPGVKFRRLGSGPQAPESAFVVRRTLPPDVRDAMVGALLKMRQDPEARPVLDSLQLKGFEPCELSEYGALYDLLDLLGPRWSETGIGGPAPQRPKWVTSQKAGG